MLCSNCENYKLLLALEGYIMSENPSDCKIIELFEEYSIIADEDMECPDCGCKIIKGESYIEDDESFLEDIFCYVADKISDTIAACERCGAGEFIQGLYPSIKSCFSDEDDDPEAIFDGFNTASTIEEIMYDFDQRCNLWEEYYEQIVRFIKCPHCGNGSGIDYDEKIDYGTFDLSTEVYTAEDIQEFNQNFYGDEWDEIRQEISGLAKNCSFEELVNLKNQYIKNRLYVVKNHIFNKLEQFIQEQYSSGNGYVLSKNRLVFRTRTEKIGKILKKEELWEPPCGYAGHGRYNDIGVSMLYCANNRDVIKKEVPLP